MKAWISERGGLLTGITATLALILAIVALVVGINAGGSDDGHPAFGGAPPQGVTPGMAPPGIQQDGSGSMP